MPCPDGAPLDAAAIAASALVSRHFPADGDDSAETASQTFDEDPGRDDTDDLPDLIVENS